MLKFPTIKDQPYLNAQLRLIAQNFKLDDYQPYELECIRDYNTQIINSFDINFIINQKIPISQTQINKLERILNNRNPKDQPNFRKYLTPVSQQVQKNLKINANNSHITYQIENDLKKDQIIFKVKFQIRSNQKPLLLPLNRYFYHNHKAIRKHKPQATDPRQKTIIKLLIIHDDTIY